MMETLRRTRDRARSLRKRMTLPEVLLWQRLRGRDRYPVWRRQHPFDIYILDFYCDAAKLVVEVDGRGHDDPAAIAHDERRTAFLNSCGLEVLRIPATDVLRDPGVVAEWLEEHAVRRMTALARL